LERKAGSISGSALRENDVEVVNSWETAYYTNFSGSAGQGPQPMVVSYGSSPPAEVIFAEQPLDDAPTASITAPNTCFQAGRIRRNLARVLNSAN
jgi:thiamine transport system substrate-binding protein